MREVSIAELGLGWHRRHGIPCSPAHRRYAGTSRRTEVGHHPGHRGAQVPYKCAPSGPSGAQVPYKCARWTIDTRAIRRNARGSAPEQKSPAPTPAQLPWQVGEVSVAVCPAARMAKTIEDNGGSADFEESMVNQRQRSPLRPTLEEVAVAAGMGGEPSRGWSTVHHQVAPAAKAAEIAAITDLGYVPNHRRPRALVRQRTDSVALVISSRRTGCSASRSSLASFGECPPCLQETPLQLWLALATSPEERLRVHQHLTPPARRRRPVALAARRRLLAGGAGGEGPAGRAGWSLRADARCAGRAESPTASRSRSAR